MAVSIRDAIDVEKWRCHQSNQFSCLSSLTTSSSEGAGWRMWAPASQHGYCVAVPLCSVW